MTTEEKFTVMHLQAMDCQQTPSAKRAKASFFFSMQISYKNKNSHFKVFHDWSSKISMFVT